jgi:outer membrane protein OmpA-like peptidoglycan-associated protein
MSLERKDTMLKLKTSRTILLIAVSLSLVGGFIGCGYPKELITADKAVESARAAGKDKECPNEFTAAESLKNEAYAVCKPCDTAKAIALANQATDRANALCPAKPVAQVETRTVPPPPPAAPAPTASLSASPSSVQAGQCSTLTWYSTNASSASINQGIGRVDNNGSRQVCPTSTTQYTLTATGAGGSRDASATVGVATKVVDRLTLHVNFDFNKATIRKPDDAELQKARDFVKKYSDFKISLVGYTDSVGSDEYNQKLSERRAEAVQAHMVANGVDAGRIKASGRGEADPVGDNATAEGRAQNRRVEILILSE